MFVWPTAKPAVLAAITILDSAFGDYAFVSAKMPSHERPARFVRVSRVGGRRVNITTDNARILVECFAHTIDEVEPMAASASEALLNSGGTTVTTTSGNVFIRGWDNESGPVDFPHPDLLDYERWQLHGDLVVKAN